MDERLEVFRSSPCDTLPQLNLPSFLPILSNQHFEPSSSFSKYSSQFFIRGLDSHKSLPVINVSLCSPECIHGIDQVEYAELALYGIPSW